MNSATQFPTSSSLLEKAAHYATTLFDADNLKFDAPIFTDQYVSFPMTHSLNIDGDFFIRAQSVGVTFKGEDVRLFYLLQDMVKRHHLHFRVQHEGKWEYFNPHLAGEGQFSMKNPCTFYLAGIASGNLKGWSDIPISRDPATFDDRAKFLAVLLYREWVRQMMPIIKMYQWFRANDLLAPIVK
jgi:hypothetical protein